MIFLHIYARYGAPHKQFYTLMSWYSVYWYYWCNWCQKSSTRYCMIVYLCKIFKNMLQCSFRALAAGKIIELQDFWCHIQIPHPQISIKRDQACLYMKIWYFLNMDKYGFLPIICSIQGPPVEILISSSYSVYFLHLRRP